jgi:hypothetical protein
MKLQVRQTIAGPWQYRLCHSEGELYTCPPVWESKLDATMAGEVHRDHLQDNHAQAWWTVG